VKAPKFEDQAGFKPEDNGLWEVKLVVNGHGSVFVNLNANAAEPVPSPLIATQGRAQGTCFDVSMLDLPFEWKQIGKWRENGSIMKLNDHSFSTC
jgi:hypothetical protein